MRCESRYRVPQGTLVRCLLVGPHPDRRHYYSVARNPEKFWHWTDEMAETAQPLAIHAVSVDHQQGIQTVCGLSLMDNETGPATGWGRLQQNVCPGVTCTDCERAMGIRT